MKLEELYQRIEGNYQEAINRFLNEDMLKMFFEKYFASTCFQELEAAMSTDDVKASFEAAHSLKGLTMSMAFTKMSESCVLLTEDLRAGKCDEQTQEYWKTVNEKYHEVKELWNDYNRQ